MVGNTFDRLTERLNKKVDEKEKSLIESQKKISKSKNKTVANSKTIKQELLTLPSGKKVRAYLQYIDPSECIVWEGNNRLDETRNNGALEELKSAIEAHGQLVPAFVRPAPKQSKYKYEVIYGSRRFAACSSLGKKLLAQVGDVPDKDALIMMDAENNARQELSVYEKALSYKKWIAEGYFKDRADLALNLGVSVTWISRIQTILKLPKEILSAFPSKADIKSLWATELNKIARLGSKHEKILVNRAKSKPDSIKDPELIYKYLLGKEKKSKNKKIEGAGTTIDKFKVKDSNGKFICSLEVLKDNSVKAIFNNEIEISEIKEKLESLYTNNSSWEF